MGNAYDCKRIELSWVLLKPSLVKLDFLLKQIEFELFMDKEKKMIVTICIFQKNGLVNFFRKTE